MPQTAPSTFDLAAQLGQEYGYNPAQIQAVQAVMRQECSNPTGACYNGNDNGYGVSAGPLQFNAHGQLAAFARALGVSIPQAAEIAQREPGRALRWAMQPGGYIYRGVMSGGPNRTPAQYVADILAGGQNPAADVSLYTRWLGGILPSGGVGGRAGGVVAASDSGSVDAGSATSELLSFGDSVKRLVLESGLVLIGVVLVVLGVILLGFGGPVERATGMRI